MGRVYAWKLVCGNDVKYAWMPTSEDDNGGISSKCADIPACSAQSTREIGSKDVYMSRFERMKEMIKDTEGEQWSSLLKDCSAYYNIGCDKPSDYQTC